MCIRDSLETCESCHGTGAAPGSNPETCPTCGGSGTVRTTERTMLGTMQVQKTCPRCGGKGKIISNPCSTCGGQGRVRKQKKLTVTVPAGINDGQTFTLRGQGDAGQNGGPAGDANITVTVPVSYTHLDVYKRQDLFNPGRCDGGGGCEERHRSA